MLAYSLFYIPFGSDGVGWMIWAFSHYFMFFALIAATERLTSGLGRKRKTAARIAMIATAVILFIVGFYISTFTSYGVLFVLSCVLYAGLSIALYVFGALAASATLEIASNAPDEDNDDKRDPENDLFLFYTKNLRDGQGKLGVRLGYALIAFVVLYIALLVFIIYANAFCDNVRSGDIAVICATAFIATAANQTQICLTSKRVLASTLAENGALAASLILYITVEWIFLPVTVNFILITICLLILMPVHIRFGIVSREYNRIYKKGKKCW